MEYYLELGYSIVARVGGAHRLTLFRRGNGEKTTPGSFDARSEALSLRPD